MTKFNKGDKIKPCYTDSFVSREQVYTFHGYYKERVYGQRYIQLEEKLAHHPTHNLYASQFMHVNTKPSSADPNGLDQHQPGAKLDAGKPRFMLVLKDMAKAIYCVVKVATFGANKYTDGGWLQVQDGIRRYDEAAERHRNARFQGEETDPESGMSHRWHEAWNTLAALELEERAKK